MLPPFVDRGFLQTHPEAVLADVRLCLDGGSERDAYAAGHLPGAVFVDLHAVLAGPADDPAVTGRHPLPTPDAFATGLGALGIGDDDLVIAYDDDSGAIAARLVWMLRAIGHEAALLDGGLTAWTGPVKTGAPAAQAAASFTPVAWPEHLLAMIDDAADTAAHRVLDARPAARFAGAPDDLDPRAGHIPGSVSVPSREHAGPDGRIADPDALRARFAEAGVTDGSDVISSCGSGVTACLNLLALEHAGLKLQRPPRLFPGSWSQWSRDETRPVHTG